MLTLKNLSLTAADAQGRADIVKNVSLDVEDGKFLVITGPNGGGKTTLAKLIMGLATPTGGQIFLDGEDITGLSITDRAKRGHGYAGMLVASLCRELLAHGATPMLYADADYPASNRAYQKIGFEKAGEVTQYRFDR